MLDALHQPQHPHNLYIKQVGSSETTREAPYCNQYRKSKDEDIVQPLLKDNGYYINVLNNVI